MEVVFMARSPGIVGKWWGAIHTIDEICQNPKQDYSAGFRMLTLRPSCGQVGQMDMSVERWENNSCDHGKNGQ